MSDKNSFEEQRRRKAANFHLMIQDNYDDEGSDAVESEPAELNSYSGQDVKAQIERESRHALKKKMRAEKKELKAKNKKNRRIFRLMWIASVLLVGAMTAVFIITGMNDLLAINRTSADTVKIQIPKDPTLDQIGDILKENDIIEQPFYFKLFAKLTKSDNDFTQGTYELSKNMDYQAIITNLEGSSSRTDTVEVTLIEGLNVVEIADKLKS